MVFIVQIIKLNAADILIYHKEPCNSINCMGLPCKVHDDTVFTIKHTNAMIQHKVFCRKQ